MTKLAITLMALVTVCLLTFCLYEHDTYSPRSGADCGCDPPEDKEIAHKMNRFVRIGMPQRHVWQVIGKPYATMQPDPDGKSAFMDYYVVTDYEIDYSGRGLVTWFGRTGTR